MHPNCIIVHYHEIALKGGNRRYFETRLQKNILAVIGRDRVVRVRLLRGRIVIDLHEGSDIQEISRSLRHVFGIAYFAPGVIVKKQDPDLIVEIARSLVDGRCFESFSVRTKRAEKGFQLDSVQVNELVGTAIQADSGAKVDLSNPEMTIHVEIFDKSTLVFIDRIEGAGGLPAGSSRRAVCLLSSGIDSPVAAWKMIRRGVQQVFVHFHSVPYTSDASVRNTKKLVEILNGYQLRSKLYIVPFLRIQQLITSQVPGKYRVLLYRRMMFRIAERIALANRAHALVTGENVGQVASQTLPNMRVISAATRLPVLRPLAGDDKQEIVQKAREIGTFETSIEPYEDCCSLFVPKNPETNAKPGLIDEAEAPLDIRDMIEEALAEAEVHYFKFKRPEKAEALHE